MQKGGTDLGGIGGKEQRVEVVADGWAGGFEEALGVQVQWEHGQKRRVTPEGNEAKGGRHEAVSLPEGGIKGGAHEGSLVQVVPGGVEGTIRRVVAMDLGGEAVELG